MPRVSIVIPALAGAESLENTLVSVLSQRPRDSEILVVLNAPYADPYDIRQEVRFLDARRGAGLVECANLGFRESRAPVVHLLCGPCEVGQAWADVAVARFRDPKLAMLAPLILRLGAADEVLARGVALGRGLRRRVVVGASAGEVLGPTCHAAFYRQSVLAEVGGFDRLVGDDHADVDLAATIRACGLACWTEPYSRVLMPALPAARQGALRQALGAERLFWRHAPERGWASSLAWHVPQVAMETAAGLVNLTAPARLVGRLLGACDLGRSRRHQQRIVDWTERLNAPPALPLPQPAPLRRAA